MRVQGRMIAAGLAAWLAAAMPVGAAEDGSDAIVVPADDWREELTDQLWHELGCEVVFIANEDVQTVDGTRIIFARAICKDGRAYDASRGDEADFRLSRCDESVTC